MKVNPLEDALRCVRNSEGQEFLSTFCRVSGYIDLAAQRDPGAFCEVGDVQEIFDRLYKMRFGGGTVSVKKQAQLIFAELEKVININYNQESAILTAIEKGIRKAETPGAATPRESK